ncbi:hypothetical protein GCM10009099_26030 [Caenispirillum bisanense]
MGVRASDAPGIAEESNAPAPAPVRRGGLHSPAAARYNLRHYHHDRLRRPAPEPAR